MINVSWDDAQQYVAWLSRRTGKRYRLPSEAEWEYAARAGTITPFSTGQCITTAQANYDGRFEYNNCGARTGLDLSKTQLVGSYPANRWGLFDMHGNVWEWVQDCYHDSYTGTPTYSDVIGRKSCQIRVWRGGSWINGPRDLRSANRGGVGPDLRSNSVGFRVARTITR